MVLEHVFSNEYNHVNLQFEMKIKKGNMKKLADANNAQKNKEKHNQYYV